jgi:hypothetical protein
MRRDDLTQFLVFLQLPRDHSSLSTSNVSAINLRRGREICSGLRLRAARLYEALGFFVPKLLEMQPARFDASSAGVSP